MGFVSMRQINIVTTIEVPNHFSQEEIYDYFFNEVIINSYQEEDLIMFNFIDVDTGENI